MRRLVTAILAESLVTGCSTRSGGKAGTIVGLGIMGFGFAVAGGILGPGGETDPSDVAFIPVTIGAIVAIASALVWSTSNPDPEDKPKAPLAKVDHRAADREQAWQLTQQAE